MRSGERRLFLADGSVIQPEGSWPQYSEGGSEWSGDPPVHLVESLGQP